MNNNNLTSQDSIASNKVNGARKILFIDRDGSGPISYLKASSIILSAVISDVLIPSIS